MLFGKNRTPARSSPDMTPMIDVTFQLVIFFLLTMNFSSDEQSELIRLPRSELAKPPETQIETPITLQLTDEGEVIVGGDQVPIEAVRPLLLRERQALEVQGRSPDRATVIIRADREARTGRVQELIEIGQKTGFEKFVLRAKEDRS